MERAGHSFDPKHRPILCTKQWSERDVGSERKQSLHLNTFNVLMNAFDTVCMGTVGLIAIGSIFSCCCWKRSFIFAQIFQFVLWIEYEIEFIAPFLFLFLFQFSV